MKEKGRGNDRKKRNSGRRPLTNFLYPVGRRGKMEGEENGHPHFSLPSTGR